MRSKEALRGDGGAVSAGLAAPGMGWRRPHGWVALGFLLLALAVLIASGFTTGRYPVSLTDVVTVFTGGEAVDAEAARVILQIRTPRIIAAVLVGLALSMSGAVYQGMFRNPLVSPDLLGASAGAGFGAALAIIWRLPAAGIQTLAFGTGLIAVVIAWSASRAMRRDTIIGLVLAGVVVSAIFGAGTSFLKYVADPDEQLPAITFWLMGGLSGVQPRQLITLAVPIGLCAVVLWFCRWRLNVLTFGDDTARSLGVSVRVIQATVVVAATLLTTSSVAVSGLIAWVGLVVPHLVRMLVGPDFRVLLPVVAVAGAVFLLAVDGIARNHTSMEIPLGILTAAIGAPFLLILIIANREW